MNCFECGAKTDDELWVKDGLCNDCREPKPFEVEVNKCLNILDNIVSEIQEINKILGGLKK